MRMLISSLLIMAMMGAAISAEGEKTFPQVKEVVVFKNGFAYVRCEGESVPVNGRIIVNEIPDASLGSFWGASLTPEIHLASIKAEEVEVPHQETMTKIEDLVQNNSGQKITVMTADKQELTGVIVGFQYYTPPEEKLEQLNPNEFYRRYGYYPYQQSQPAAVRQIEWLTLKTASGITAVRVSDIKTFSLEGDKVQTTKTITAKTRQLILTFDGEAAKMQKGVKYTLFFIVKGIRWIPDYKIELTGPDRANLKLSATVLNEGWDIKDARVRLMVGYPHFAFGESLTPLTLREARRALSVFFRPPAGGRGDGYLMNIAAQSVAMDESRSRSEMSALPVESANAEEGVPVEDLFGYDIKNEISLLKNNAVLMPLAETQHPIEHLYELDTWSFRPLLRRGNVPRQVLERIMMPDWDKVWHKLVVKNQSEAPITTAPATIFEKGQPLAQEMIKYAPPKGETTVPVTIAVDIMSNVNETETGRQHNALTAMDRNWDLVTHKGEITLHNKKKTAVDLVIKRHLLGKVSAVSLDGKSETSSQGWEEFIMKLWEGTSRDYYWNWWDYYGYYPSVNPISFARWDISLKPDEKVTIEYTYSYYEYR